jgi:hypothetical protein
MPSDEITTPTVSSDQDDLPIRGRLCALELLLVQIIADRLAAARGDPSRSAAELFESLATAAERMTAPGEHCAEQQRLRDHIKFGLFEVLNAASKRLP